MVELLKLLLLFVGINAGIPEAKVADSEDSAKSGLVEDSKSGLSSKDGMSKDALPEPLPNPLDRMIIQWEPPIINPPHITNVNP